VVYQPLGGLARLFWSHGCTKRCRQQLAVIMKTRPTRSRSFAQHTPEAGEWPPAPVMWKPKAQQQVTCVTHCTDIGRRPISLWFFSRGHSPAKGSEPTYTATATKHHTHSEARCPQLVM
jgi:hypothetical protein